MSTGLDKILLAFAIGQRVAIVDTDSKEAIIQAVLMNAEGFQYQIAYWHDNIRRVEWVFPCELRKL